MSDWASALHDGRDTRDFLCTDRHLHIDEDEKTSNQIQQDVTPLKPATTGRGNAVKRKARQAVAEVTQPRPQRLRKAKKIFDPSDL